MSESRGSVKCCRCGKEMEPQGPAFLDQCDGATRTARKWLCPHCPEGTVSILPDPPIVYGRVRVEGSVTWLTGAAS